MWMILGVGLVACFTSSLTAALGVGGGVVLLALLAQLVPPQVLIPLHGAAQFISNVNRVAVQRAHIEWTYIRPFLLGSILGAALLVPLVQWVRPELGQVLLGIFILTSTWRAQWLRLNRWPAVVSGAITSGLSLILGATGPLVMSVLPKNTWSRHGLVATHAMAMVLQHGLKVLAFSSLDFDWSNWWPLLVSIGIGTWLGNRFGAVLLARLDEAQFKHVLDWILTVLALRLMWQGLEGLL